MKISWCILTHPEKDQSVIMDCLLHNLKNTELPHERIEIVWCSNGPIDAAIGTLLDSKVIQTFVLYDKNNGVARGYNTTFALATGTHLVVTGCDMKMPAGWLRQMKECFEKIPDTGIVSIYSQTLDKVPERFRGQIEEVNGIRIQKALPIERRMFSREVLNKVGYLDESYGLYGWEDVAWAYRAERVLDEAGLRYYVLPDILADHMGTEGCKEYDGKDKREYWEFKQDQIGDQFKEMKIDQGIRNGFPYFNPFR